MQEKTPFHGHMRVKRGVKHTTLSPYKTARNIAFIIAFSVFFLLFIFYYNLIFQINEKIVGSIIVIFALTFFMHYFIWVLTGQLFLILPKLRYAWAVLLGGISLLFFFSLSQVPLYLTHIAPILSDFLEPKLFDISPFGYFIALLLLLWFLRKTVPLPLSLS